MDEDLNKLKKVVKVLTFAIVRIAQECRCTFSTMNPAQAAKDVGTYAEKELS